MDDGLQSVVCDLQPAESSSGLGIVLQCPGIARIEADALLTDMFNTGRLQYSDDPVDGCLGFSDHLIHLFLPIQKQEWTPLFQQLSSDIDVSDGQLGQVEVLR